jgi:hypothetical protein
MEWITSLDDLHAHYGTPGTPAMTKVAPHLTPLTALFWTGRGFAFYQPSARKAPTAARVGMKARL